MAANRITIKPNTGCVNQLPAGYEIKFGSILFQATGDGNLMRIVEERPVSEWTGYATSTPGDGVASDDAQAQEAFWRTLPACTSQPTRQGPR